MPEFFFPLVKRKEIAEGTMAFFFDSSSAKFSFKAGQFVRITLLNPPETDAEGNTRSFTIASPPSLEGKIMIATRMRDTAFKRVLKSMPLGTKVSVKGPAGNFIIHEDSSKTAVFLAGGIGVTPFHGMIQHASEMKLPHRMILFYANRTKLSAAFLDEFEVCAKENRNFSFVPLIEDANEPEWKYEKGRIDESVIHKHVPDIHGSIFYVCGPPAMVAAMKDLLKKMGIADENVKSEEFTGY